MSIQGVYPSRTDMRVAPRIDRWCLAILFASIVAIVSTSILVAASNGGPPLTVSSPEENLVTNNETITVSGRTDASATVTIRMANIDGSVVILVVPELDGEGRFEHAHQASVGRWSIMVNASTGDGNTTSVVRDVLIDLNPPVLEIIYPDHSPVYTNQLKYDITLQLADPDYPPVIIGDPPWHLTLIVNDTDPHPALPGIAQVFVDLHEGRNEIELRLMDPAGNEDVELLVFIVDVTPPVLSVTRPAGDTHHTNETTVRLEGTIWAAYQAVVIHKDEGLEVTLVDGDYDDGSWVHDLELDDTDLESTVTVRAIDRAGNRAEVSILVILDTVPPELVMDPVPSGVNRPQVWLNGTTGEDIESVRINGVEYSVIDGFFTVPYFISMDQNEIILEVQDKAGNRAFVRAVVEYDIIPPSLELEVPERVSEDFARIVGTTDADVIRVEVNGLPYTVVNGSFDIRVNLTEGDNTFRVVVFDHAGNTEGETVTVEYSTPGFGAGLCFITFLLMLIIYTRKVRARS